MSRILIQMNLSTQLSFVVNRSNKTAIYTNHHHFNFFESSRTLTATQLRQSHAMTENKIGVVQLNCKSNIEENFCVAESYIKQAAEEGAKIVFLPECADFIANNHKELMEISQPLTGDIVSKYKQLAAKCQIWISLGVHEKDDASIAENKILNSHLVIDSKGEIKSVYHKLHLFNLDLPGVVRLVESEHFVAGKQMVKPVENTPAGKIGLAICYDLRFPELSIAYGKAGCDVIAYPASFTKPTGKAHWKPLLQARAIENQCYVVAAAQAGVHNKKRGSYGHSMVIDPWGEVVMEIDDEENAALGFATINFKRLEECRQKLPVWKDRRTDIYADIKPADQYD